MEPFIVSARKYRPETFEDVVGQRAITQTLENAIKSNHLAQALLFTGPRGVGKTTCARILAKKINQESGDYSPDEDFAFNIFELDAASNNGVEHIRSIVDQVRIPPQVGKYKVYIIDEVHMLSNAAFNAFLKTLEEPPSHAIFILATTEKHKIIPTILSRCQIFDFKRITVGAMRDHLKRIAQQEGINAEEEALQIIAQKADGALRDSLSIFDRVVSFSGKDLTVQAVTENLNVLDRDTYFKVTDLILDGDIPNLLVTYDEILAKGFDGHHFISGLASHFRDLMVCKDERTIQLLELGEKTKAKYKSQSSHTDLGFLREAIEIANNADFNYRASRNQRLHVELAIMKLASVLQDGEKKNSNSYIVGPEKFTETLIDDVKPTEEQKQETAHVTKAAPSKVISEEPSTYRNSEKPIESTSPVPEKTPHLNSQNFVDTYDREAQLKAARARLSSKTKETVSSSSIKAIQVKNEHVAKAAQKVIKHDELPTKPFSQEELNLVWNKYVDYLENKGQRILASILNADDPELIEKSGIRLKFPNKSMKEDLEKNQGTVLEHLKRELNNYNIYFDIIVDEQVTKKYVFTEQEKYQKLSEKNPALELLRKTFDLDFK
ncbi:DNA polymerase III subunit gamma/tau [Nonlabens tegetincola]|uniref:DNA polymerase III subunit gamma/tau n=1 Tax=Nonlabens tegetincola TaxID=323273 RepID=UPI000CF4E988|nr:DNA polymerase III subunit gamma/tau [Nonlabens tegetincola]PQJ17153.1 DNA polymerase III, subunit gamma and tau [Nonlabens tegetincola]